MSVIMDRTHPRAMGRGQAFLLAAAFPLFLGALLCDWAYWSTYQVQWSNFASWLLAGGLVFAGIAMVLSLFGLFGGDRRGGLGYFLLLLALFITGFLDSLVHARDAWAVMPMGLVLSVLVLALAALATWLAFRGLRREPLP